jgi:hypothetical protein
LVYACRVCRSSSGCNSLKCDFSAGFVASACRLV